MKDFFGFIAFFSFLIAGSASDESYMGAIVLVIVSFVCGFVVFNIEKKENEKNGKNQ